LGTFYNTGNAVPSSAVKDLFDNSLTEDEFVNSPSLTAITRTGKQIKTISGMQNDVAKAIATGVLISVGPYAAGLTVGNYNQYFSYMGEFYKALPSTPLPYTMTGVPATDLPFFGSIGDAALRAQLASSLPGNGASLVYGALRTMATVADLRAATVNDGKTIFVLAHHANSLGGGMYRLVPGDTTTADDDGYRITASDGSRYRLDVTQGVEPEAYGAMRNGGNDTPAFQSALDYAFTVKMPVVMQGGNYGLGVSAIPGATFCLLNKGVSFIGVGAIKSTLQPVAGLSASVDFMQLQPQSSVLDWIEFRDFLWYPGALGSPLGRRGIVVNMSEVSNASSILFDGVYFAPGNDYSLDWVTNATNNPQGGPANCLFNRCHFWEGVRLVNSGDSINFRHNVFRTSPGSGRVGVQAEGISAGGGQPAQLSIEWNNFDCDGGAVWLKNGLSAKVRYNNIEQSHGTGSSSSAVVDFDGNANQLGYCEIVGNNFGIFGTASVGQAIRINNAVGTLVDNNRLLAAGPSWATRAILITSAATDTAIGRNEISAGFGSAILDAGVGTRGIPRAVSPINGFGNFGSGYKSLTVTKNVNGGATYGGRMTCPTSASGLLFASIPLGFRVPVAERVAATCTAGGTIQPAVVELLPDGSAVFYTAAASPTEFSFSITTGDLGYVIGDV
jgi:hypothetical protein